MTPREIEIEKAYRVDERLGILCGDGLANPEAIALANREANEWECRFLGLPKLGVDIIPEK